MNNYYTKEEIDDKIEEINNDLKRLLTDYLGLYNLVQNISNLPLIKNAFEQRELIQQLTVDKIILY